MRPPVWPPPVERLSVVQAIIKRIRWAMPLVLLRQHRHERYSDPLQQELAALYTSRPVAHASLATILRADTGVSHDEVSEATTRDRRW